MAWYGMDNIFIGPFMFGLNRAFEGLLVLLGVFSGVLCALVIIVIVIGVVLEVIEFIVDKFKR